jgi:hypothetical protein
MRREGAQQEHKDKDGTQYMVSDVSNKKFSSFQHVFI